MGGGRVVWDVLTRCDVFCTTVDENFILENGKGYLFTDAAKTPTRKIIFLEVRVQFLYIILYKIN